MASVSKHCSGTKSKYSIGAIYIPTSLFVIGMDSLTSSAEIHNFWLVTCSVTGCCHSWRRVLHGRPIKTKLDFHISVCEYNAPMPTVLAVDDIGRYAYTEQRRGCASKQDSSIYHGEACNACPVRRPTFTTEHHWPVGQYQIIKKWLVALLKVVRGCAELAWCGQDTELLTLNNWNKPRCSTGLLLYYS